MESTVKKNDDTNNGKVSPDSDASLVTSSMASPGSPELNPQPDDGITVAERSPCQMVETFVNIQDTESSMNQLLLTTCSPPAAVINTVSSSINNFETSNLSPNTEISSVDTVVVESEKEISMLESADTLNDLVCSVDVLVDSQEMEESSKSSSNEMVVDFESESLPHEAAIESSPESLNNETTVESPVESLSDNVAAESISESTAIEMTVEPLTESVEPMTESESDKMVVEASHDEMTVECPPEMLPDEMTPESPLSTLPNEMDVDSSSDILPNEKIAESPIEMPPNEISESSPSGTIPIGSSAVSPSEISNEMTAESQELLSSEMTVDSPTELMPSDLITDSSKESLPNEMAADSPSELVSNEVIENSPSELMHNKASVEPPKLIHNIMRLESQTETSHLPMGSKNPSVMEDFAVDLETNNSTVITVTPECSPSTKPLTEEDSIENSISPDDKVIIQSSDELISNNSVDETNNSSSTLLLQNDVNSVPSECLDSDSSSMQPTYNVSVLNMALDFSAYYFYTFPPLHLVLVVMCFLKIYHEFLFFIFI